MGIKKNITVKYILFSAVLIISGGARALGLMPFGIGLFISMVFIGLNPLVLSPVYMGSSLMYSFDWTTLLGSAVVSAVMIALWIIRKFKKFPEYIYYIISPLSLIGFLPQLKNEAAPAILFIFFVPIFLYVGQSFFYPLLKRGLKFKLLDHELICGGVILCVLALGLNRAEFFYFPLVAVFAAFTMLMAGRIYGLSGALVTGLCFGIGGAIYDYQIVWLAYYPVMALLAAVFVPAPRVISASAVLIGYTLITFFFNIDAPYAHMWLAALLAGGIFYVIIPKKRLAALKDMLNPDYNPAGLRYNINLLKDNASKSIFRTGEVFEEMARYLLSGAEYKLQTESLTGRIKSEVCAGCGKKCSVRDADIAKLIEVSVEKGRATVVDLPTEIIEGCKFSAAMIAATARVADEYHKKQEKKTSESLAKGIVSDQLLGIGDVLKNMSTKLASPVSYDFEKENKIKEELTYRGIYCYDAVLSPSAVTLVVAGEHYDKQQLEKILKKTAKANYAVETEESGGTGMIIYAPLRPSYDVVFSVAGIAKGDISGDTHSFIKIGNDRFLMALCDGMGSGERAEKFSAGTISLIECFYKAGFDHASVIKSVNRFLSLSGDEAFAASDICVLDLNSGVADIFKIGSPACYVKGAESVRAIEGSSLPIGATDDIRPSFSQAGLSGGDMVVLVSDGISDCFDGDGLAAEISCASDISPKAVCDRILAAAKAKGGKIRDDMTVAALRIFENI